MRVRRNFSTCVDWRRWFGWLPGGPGEAREPAAAERDTQVPRTPTRWWVRLGWAFLGAVMAGYLLAAFALFPAPFFVANRTVPYVIGMSRDEADDVIRQRALLASTVEEVLHPVAPRGVVVWQDPPAEVVVAGGTTVQLTVSAGPQQIPVPDVAGYDAELARTLVEAAGLTVGRIDSVPTAAPRDVAVNTRPPAGATRAPGSAVTLVVSVGAPTLLVPDLVGLSLDEAQDSLEQAGLLMGTYWRETSSAQPPGVIFKQTPQPRTLTAPGTPINVVLAQRSP